MTTTIPDTKPITGRAQPGKVVLFPGTTDDEALREMQAYASMSDEERAAEIKAILEAADAADDGDTWQRPAMFAATEEHYTALSATTDKGITFHTVGVKDPDAFAEQLQYINGLKRCTDGGRVTVTMLDATLPDRYDCLGEQLAHFLRDFRFLLSYYRDTAGVRHALIMLPHSGIPVETSDEFAVRIRDGVLPFLNNGSFKWVNQSARLSYRANIRKIEDVEIFDGALLDGQATARYWGLYSGQEDAGAEPQLIQQAPDKGRPLVDGMIQVGDYGVIYSPPNTGKTTFAAYLGYCVANGIDVLGFMRTKRTHVIYVDLEFNNIDGMLQACAEIHGETNGWRDRFHIENNLTDLGNDAAVDIWCAQMKRKTGDAPVLVIVDTQRKAARNSTFNGQALKENGNDDMTVIANALMRISCRLNGAAFSLHHTTKANEEVMAGGGALEAGITSAFVLTVPDKSKPDYLNIAATKRRGNGMPKSIWYGLEFLNVRIMTEDEEAAANAEADDWLRDARRSAYAGKAPSHQNRWQKFDTGPQTHAKTVYPGLFEPFDVRKGAISGNENKTVQRRTAIDAVREFVNDRPKTTSADLVTNKLAPSPDTARDYLKTLHASGLIAQIEPRSGKKGAVYGPAS